MKHGAPRREGGYSLTELMIVVVIVAILAAVVIPAYTQYARESKRADAHAALLRIATQQERFFGDRGTYAGSLKDDFNYPATALSPDRYWTLSLTNVSGTGFEVRAIAGGERSHTDPDCNVIRLTSTGAKSGLTSGGAANNDCW
ncbi:MAG: type IV pilin protein [Ectothiorhodospiraceae bacterium]|nr:type IV pilin protein [Chromatiales bacterium]MCP5155338.1 type IV pilin protein [Ectothiorhodospiraceae bacterium]